MKDDRALIELVSRVEAATGPDQELDADIYFMRNCSPTPSAYRWLDYDVSAEKYPWLHPGGTPTNAHMVSAPPVTASIDAAMTLIPKGWFTRLAMEDRHSHSWRWDLRGGFGVDAGARAATPALALCAAALRATIEARKPQP